MQGEVVIVKKPIKIDLFPWKDEWWVILTEISVCGFKELWYWHGILVWLRQKDLAGSD